MKKLVFTVLAMSCLSYAGTPRTNNVNHQQSTESAITQQGIQTNFNSPFATKTCSFTFSAGSGNTSIKYCVTANGNITQLAIPSDQEHLASSTFGEGYGICDVNSGVEYDDYGYVDSGNWGAASIMNQTATSVKIARTTLDGAWTLTQTISMVPTVPSAKITMVLKNNTRTAKQVRVIRYADINADGQIHNTLDTTQNSAFEWNSAAHTPSPFGLILQNGAGQTVDAFVQNVQSGPAPCNPFLNQMDGPIFNTDGSVVMEYLLTIAAGKSQTVNLNYRGL